jgi:hypothetical protein
MIFHIGWNLHGHKSAVQVLQLIIFYSNFNPINFENG